MSFPLTYRDAMTQLAQLAGPGQPASVRQQALSAIIRELSPSNPRHEDILRALGPEPSPNPTFPAAPLSAEQRTEFHLHPVEPDPAAPASGPDLPPDDEDNLEEEDDLF